jgi:hypothetical protein
MIPPAFVFPALAKKNSPASSRLTEGPQRDARLMKPLLCHLSYAAENRVDTKNALL